MPGAFSHWQPEYAARGIATFPVRVADKRPKVSGYLNLGTGSSRKLAARFVHDDAFGFAVGPRSRVTVLDIDSSDERIVADALDHHGKTPVVVRSGGGNHQAWYRHDGEGRHIRPFAGLPIDVLGQGFTIAPPSAGRSAPYQFLSGSLADLEQLPILKNKPPRNRAAGLAGALNVGQRNSGLFKLCLRAAKGCDDFDSLLDAAQTTNESFALPLPPDEVAKVARSAWRYEQQGQNWASGAQSRKRLAVSHDEVDGLLADDPDAFVLLTVLRRHHWGRSFVVANGMAPTMPGGGWRRERLAAARASLIQNGKISCLRPANGYGPALFGWPSEGGAQN